MIRRVIVLPVAVLAALAACGGSPRATAASPDSEPTVEIPEVSEKESRGMAEEEPAPAASRSEPRSGGAGTPPIEEPGAEGDGPWPQPNPWGSGGGGPDCNLAADCCLKFVQKNGPDPSLLTMCAGVRQAPASACTQLLASFRQLAPQIGIQCN